MRNQILSIVFLAILLTNCVSVKKYNSLNADYQKSAEGDRAYQHIKAVQYADSINNAVIQQRKKKEADGGN